MHTHSHQKRPYVSIKIRLTHSTTVNLLIVFLLFLSVILQTNSFLSANDQWLMIAAKRWLSGGNYYHDFVENNPPLIIFISAIPVYLSTILKTPIILTFQIFIFFIGIISLWLSNQLLQKIFDSDHSTTALLTLGIAFTYWIIPGFAFGEREHLMLMLTLPYLLSIALRCDQKPIAFFYATTLGFFAALGFGLKPHFLIMLTLTELYGFFRIKSMHYCMRPELLMLCLTLLLYCVFIFFLTPSYITDIFPMVLHFYLGFENNSWAQLLFEEQYLVILIALLFPIIFIRYFNARQHLLWLFYFSLLGSITIFLIQRKLWYYHMYPMFSFSFLLLVFYVIQQRKNFPAFSKKIFSFALPIIGFISLFTIIFSNNLSPIVITHNPNSNYSKINKIIASYAKKSHVYFFMTELADITPLSNRLNSLSPRFPAFWMLPGILHCLNQGQNATCYSSAIQLKHYLLHAVANDFAHYHPALVIVRTGKHQPYLYEPPYLTIQNFDFINFFSENKQFKKTWSHYHFVTMINHEEIFSLDKTLNSANKAN